MKMRYMLYSPKYRGFLVKFGPKRTESGAVIIAHVSADPRFVDKDGANCVIATEEPQRLLDMLETVAAWLGTDAMAEPFVDFQIVAVPDTSAPPDVPGVTEA